MVVRKGVEERGFGGRGRVGLSFEAGSHAIVQDGVEGALVYAIADSEVVVDHASLVSVWRRRLWRGSFLLTS